MESEQKGKGLITLSIVMILIVVWELDVCEFKFAGYEFELTRKQFSIGWISLFVFFFWRYSLRFKAVSYTHLRAHETVLDLVCRLLLEKKKQKQVTRYSD